MTTKQQSSFLLYSAIIPRYSKDSLLKRIARQRCLVYFMCPHAHWTVSSRWQHVETKRQFERNPDRGLQGNGNCRECSRRFWLKMARVMTRGLPLSRKSIIHPSAEISFGSYGWPNLYYVFCSQSPVSSILMALSRKLKPSVLNVSFKFYLCSTYFIYRK